MDNTSTGLAEVFGPVIYKYSREDAIQDGYLVDASKTAREAGFRVPVALTSNVWRNYVEVPEGMAGQDESGRLWDILWVCRYEIAVRRSPTQTVYFRVKVRVKEPGGFRVAKLKAVSSSGDSGEPVMTIMLTDED